jgi:hypothetical protein
MPKRGVDPPGYQAVHQWMRKHFPLTGVCGQCGRTGRTERAEAVPGTLSRDPADWLELCKPCHMRYDGLDIQMSQRRAGVLLSDEHKAKIAASLRGKQLTAAHRAKISASRRGKPKKETT